MTALELDKKFDDNEEDILEYFELSSMRKINQEAKKVNKEVKHIGVSKQAVIKICLAERLNNHKKNL
jgi:hypothetical protein